MTDDNIRANILDEVDKAEREYAAAVAVRGMGSPDIAVSRAYYCMLHYARALLLTEGLEARSHSGVIHTLHTNFVRTGRFSAETARHLTTLEAERLKADYDVAVVFTDAIAERALTQAQEFADACRQLLRSTGHLS